MSAEINQNLQYGALLEAFLSLVRILEERHPGIKSDLINELREPALHMPISDQMQVAMGQILMALDQDDNHRWRGTR